MLFYRVHWWTDEGVIGGYNYYSDKSEMLKEMRDAMPVLGRKDTFEEINIEPTGAGILAALNRYASHSGNG